jgi:hypothetical protein
MAIRKGDDKGGDKGKSPNVTGTQPKGHESREANSPGAEAVYEGPAGRGAVGSKRAADVAKGARTTEPRKGGPRKTPARTTTRSGDK